MLRVVVTVVVVAGVGLPPPLCDCHRNQAHTLQSGVGHSFKQCSAGAQGGVGMLGNALVPDAVWRTKFVASIQTFAM